VPPATTHISAKTDWTMRTKVPVTITGNSGSFDFTLVSPGNPDFGAALLPGDMDGDNQVTGGDDSIVQFFLGLSNEDAQALDPEDNPNGDLSDLDGDGQTTAGDVSIEQFFLGLQGADY